MSKRLRFIYVFIMVMTKQYRCKQQRFKYMVVKSSINEHGYIVHIQITEI